jgi:hypothetical protein
VKNKRNLKILSQSVLLEESGLPGVNTLIILIVFLMLVAFVTWSVNMRMNETLTVNGYTEQITESSNEMSFKALIPSKDIGIVNEGYPVIMNILGLTDKNHIMGKIGKVDLIAIKNAQGSNMFEASIVPSNLDEVKKHMNGKMVPGMETSVQIITGTRSLFQYFIGPIFQIKDKVFKEK